MKKIYLLFILIPFFSIAQKLEGQKLIDSLLVELPKVKIDSLRVRMFIELSSVNKDINPEMGVKYADKSLALSKKINWDYGIVTSYGVKAINLTWMSKYNEAISNYNLALQSNPSKKALSRIYRGIGIVYLSQSNYPKALEFNNRALKLFEERNDKEGISSILSNNGNIQLELKDYKKAIESFNKALAINKLIDNKQYMSVNLMNIAAAYYKLNNNEKSLIYDNQALVLAKSLGDKSMEAAILANIALVYKDMKQYDKALKNQQEAYKINKSSGFESDLAFNIGGIGRIYLEKAKIENNIILKNSYLKKAIDNLNEYLVFLKKNQELKETGTCLESISEVQKLQGNYKASLESHEQYVIYKDSVFNSDNKETIKNLEDKREIELRDKQIKINKLSLEAKEKQKWLFVAGIGFLAIIGGLLFYQSRKRKLTNLKLETLNKDLDQANKAKTRFFGILNHDLRGPVSNLVIFLQLQQEAPEMLDEESTKRMQDKTMTGAKNLLASMEDILQWSKSQMENFKPQPKNVSINQLFDDTKKVFSGYLNIKIEYQNPDNIEIFTDDNYLKTIIRNLTSNAINVLAEFISPNEKQIIWKAWQKDKISYLSITDNGPGANPEKLKALFEESELGSTKSGLGLHLIRDMAKAIDCEISVESTIGIGTTFTLKLN
jgi:signal transduction histidine kinase